MKRWGDCAHQVHYRHTLENLGTEPGLVGIIFRKAQNKISNPSDLQRVIKMIADEDWSGMDVDIKGAIYEGCEPHRHSLEKPWTKDLWIYDLRTNQHFCLPSSGSAESLRIVSSAVAAKQSLKTNPLAEKDLEDFIKVYKPPTRARRKDTDRFKKFTYDEIVARDKANLDIVWLKDESLEDTENLPPPAELAAEIVTSLESALEEFRGVEDALTNKPA